MHTLIKAVIFDMDGVITDTMPYHFKAWKEIFKRQGIHVTHEDIYTREGQKGIDSVREIFTEQGKAFDEALARKLLKEKEELFKEIFKRRFITGSRSFIKGLKRRQLLLALVTGTSRHEAKRLLPEDLWDCFHATVCGCDVQNGKPHPEPYLRALAHLNIRPGEAIVLENAPFGIRSAKAAGIKCIAIETSLPRRYLTQADKVFLNYKQISNYLGY